MKASAFEREEEESEAKCLRKSADRGLQRNFLRKNFNSMPKRKAPPAPEPEPVEQEQGAYTIAVTCFHLELFGVTSARGCAHAQVACMPILSRAAHTLRAYFTSPSPDTTYTYLRLQSLFPHHL